MKAGARVDVELVVAGVDRLDDGDVKGMGNVVIEVAWLYSSVWVSVDVEITGTNVVSESSGADEAVVAVE